MTISIIVAITKNFAIGKDNNLLYHMPNDMKRFKETTTGHPIIMGRKTFESFPRRPLPNRRNIVLSHNIPSDQQGAEWVNSLQEAIDLCKDEEEVFIIGGAHVYNQALALANKLYLTIIDDEPQDADSFFPSINYSEWKELKRDERQADERHTHNYTFLDLEK